MSLEFPFADEFYGNYSSGNVYAHTKDDVRLIESGRTSSNAQAWEDLNWRDKMIDELRMGINYFDHQNKDSAKNKATIFNFKH